MLVLLGLILHLQSNAQTYCTPTVGITGATGDFINNFTFNTLSNLNSGDNPSDYLLYPQTTNVIQGQTYAYTIQTGSASWPQGIGWWIDYNGDGDFDDVGEFVYSSPSTVLNTTILSGNITVPIGAIPGVRRLRLACLYNGTMTSTQSCAITGFGEYEDYNITVVANVACTGTPTAGTAAVTPTNPCPGTNITLSLSGNSLLGNLSYQWLHSTSPNGPWTAIPTATTIPFSYVPPLGTSYYRCIVTCMSPGGGFDTSSVAGPMSVQTWSPTSSCYCVSSATSAFYEEITNVTMGTLNNTTDCLNPLTGTQGVGTGVAKQYTNFTATVPAPIVYIGLAQPFSVTIGNCDGFSLGSGTKIYIDYNQNSSFSDPGEEVYFSGLTSTTSVPATTLTGSFTPPATALPGITRMRVVNQYQGFTTATTITPCNSYTYGETEDYLINLIPPQPFDPAITAMTAPGGNCYSANQVITVQLRNYGSNMIDLSINPVTVTLVVNGPNGQVLYNATASTGFLNPYGASAVTVPFIGVNMFAGGTYTLNTTLVIAGLTNGNLFNDSLQNAVVRLNYRPTAGAPYQLCQYGSIPFGQGMTVSGCSTPIQDSVTITFTLAPTTNPTATNPAGAALFATGTLPALPVGSTIGVCEYKVTNLATTAGGWANEARFPLFYGPMPVQGANVLYPSIQGNPATSSGNYTWTNAPSAAVIGNIYNVLGNGGTINMGYHSTWGGNATINGYTLNAGGNPTVATLKIRYSYVPASFEWYSTPSGGVSLYPFSPFNPLVTTGSPLTNSNVPGTYTFYAACVGSSGCRVPVNLVINPIPVAVQDTLALCESTPGSNSAIFNLTSMNASVSNNAPGTIVE
ncbi:MAG: hypothetical protein FGM54_04475, partial [Chitinophagaceae bacterium]|nr:hypothetical protein [Chitinophagaceae bacterium]